MKFIKSGSFSIGACENANSISAVYIVSSVLYIVEVPFYACLSEQPAPSIIV